MPVLINSEDALHQAIGYLRDLDPAVVDRMLALGGHPPLRTREPGFEGMVWIILSQQVSVDSGNATFARLKEAVCPLDPPSVLSASEATMRACGLSGAKVRAVQALAQAVKTGAIDLAGLGALPAHAAHGHLCSIKGIGPWSANVFLLFCLGHPDAFPAADIALQEAARHVLDLEERPDAKALEAISLRWQPWRGVAARLLWASYRALKQGRSGMILEEVKP